MTAEARLADVVRYARMMQDPISAEAQREGCIHPGLFANDSGPDTLRYCGTCNHYVPNRDL